MSSSFTIPTNQFGTNNPDYSSINTELSTPSVPLNSAAIRNKKESFWKKTTTGQLWSLALIMFHTEGESTFFFFFFTLMLNSQFANIGLQFLVNFGAMYIAILWGGEKNVGHINPIFTILRLILGKFDPYSAVFSLTVFLAQPVFGYLAVLFVYAFVPGNDKSQGLGTTNPINPGWGPEVAFGLHLVAGFIWYSVYIRAIMTHSDRHPSLIRNTIEVSNKRTQIWDIATITSLTYALLTVITSNIIGTNLMWYSYFLPASISGKISNSLGSSNWWVPFCGGPLSAILALSYYKMTYYLDEFKFHKTQKMI